VPGVDVLIVDGDPDNIKVTTQADLEAAERLLTR
jgi:2-C-methyl-D-erythritol 4-phosphate cytidylyltransferase